jgi:nucleoside-diphosphate-sugar epimerase
MVRGQRSRDLKMKRVLVTGGSGFFGGALVRGLAGCGYSIRVLDLEQTNATRSETQAEFIRGDVRDGSAVARACAGADYVFHNAAILPISRSSKKIFWEVNVSGTENVLKSAQQCGVRKVIFISSSAPYGIPKETPIKEDTPFNPVCDYGRSKVAAENICREYRAKGLDVVILRPRTIVGKGRLGLFQILFSWISENKNIYILGKGDNLFSFLSDKDLVSACLLTLEKECRNADFNLGADRFGTVREDLEALIRYAEKKSKIISIPPRPAAFILGLFDSLNLAPFTPWHYKTPHKPFYFDISKAKRVLGWQPQMSNFDLLRESYDWYLSEKKKVDGDYGVTHSKSVRQKVLRFFRFSAS